MKLVATLLTATAAALAATNAAHATVIDDFSGSSLSPAYTQTAVLDQGATRNVSYGINTTSGTLQAVSNGSDGAEQVLLLRSDFTLGVGQILRADVNVSGINSSGTPATTGLNQDLAIAISSTAAPTINNIGGSDRSNYMFVGFRGDATHLISSGFDGTTSLGTNQVFNLNITGLYIQRDSATKYEVGYNSSGGPDTLAFTFNLVNSSTLGNAVGFYTDMRAGNTIGQLDNLRIDVAPEPASLSLLALAALPLLKRRR